MTFPKPSEAHSTIATHDKPDKSQFRRRRSIPSTIAEEEGQHMDHSPRPPRRSNSVRTTESSSLESRRASFRSSTDSLFMPPRPEGVHDELHEEPSLWYSAPLLFAIVPAVGGVAFKKGTVLLTDFALLSLAAVYLNWCLITPWIWYHSARKVNIAEPPLQGPISEETLEEDLHQDVHDDTPEHGVLSEGENPGKDWMASQDTSKESNVREASAELQLHELAALATCVLGPLLGSYILHLIRSSLSSLHGGQLVSNLHLTLFVLGAELRPIRRKLPIQNISFCECFMLTSTVHRLYKADPSTNTVPSTPRADRPTRADRSRARLRCCRGHCKPCRQPRGVACRGGHLTRRSSKQSESRTERDTRRREKSAACVAGPNRRLESGGEEVRKADDGADGTDRSAITRFGDQAEGCFVPRGGGSYLLAEAWIFCFDAPAICWCY